MATFPLGYYDCSGQRYSPEIEREIQRRVEDERMRMQKNWYAQVSYDPAVSPIEKPKQKEKDSNLLLLLT